MTPSNGKCRVNAVELGEVELNLLRPEPILIARYAFTNVGSGTRFGMGNKNQGWSEETFAKLAELQASMESDIVASLFEQDSGPSPTETIALPTGDGVPGL